MSIIRHGALALLACAAMAGSAWADLGDYTVLHQFGGYPDDGARPLYGALAFDGEYLYGSTEHGGSQMTGGTYIERGGGTLFRIKTDGTAYEMLHDFQLSSTDGLYAKGQPVLYGGQLYGMTNLGGDNGAGGTASGTVYRIDTNGDNFTLLHSFQGGATDGSLPYTGLAAGQVGGVDYLYGMTKSGGTYDKGAIFRINADGTGYTHLHDFDGGNDPGDDLDDGREPWGSVTLHDGKLYGMTRHGGDDDKGTLFRINVDGASYQRLHEFGYPPDGQQPFGQPMVYNNQLYGMCINGGNVNPAWGIVYRCDLDGGNYQIIHHFEGDPDGGRQPHGELMELNGMLYGMSLWGGEYGWGDVFSIDPITGDYTNIHSFTAWDSPDGADPYGTLTTDGRYLYGMASDGGLAVPHSSYGGVIFKIDTLSAPAVLAGDANNDGVVSADDFAAVQTNFGNTGAADGLLPGDANDDGVVSADDFAAIQTNFGNVLASSAGNTAVPEPATLVLVLGSGAMVAARRRRSMQCIGLS